MIAALAIAMGVALSSETWTERQVFRARFPRKLVRRHWLTSGDYRARCEHRAVIGAL